MATTIVDIPAWRPGPATPAADLTAWLAVLDPTLLTRDGNAEAMLACQHLESWVQARRLAHTAAFTAKADPVAARFVSSEIAALLRLSDSAAETMLGLAVDLALRLPGTF